MNKEELVNQIIPLLRLATPAEESRMRSGLETNSLTELRLFLEVVSSRGYQKELDELAEDQMLQINAGRAADLAIFKLQRDQATAPQRKQAFSAQLIQDKQTFADAARTLHSFAINDANFHLVRQTLGEGFSLYAIQQMLAANGAILSPPTQQELDEWESERIENHNDALLKMDPEALRARVRQESVERQQATKQEQAGRELEAAKQRDQYGNFRPLPPEIDSKAIKTASALQLRNWMRLYGSFQITVRLKESASAASSAGE
jgi:hypothetical protein